MKMRIRLLSISLIGLLLISSCKKDEEKKDDNNNNNNANPMLAKFLKAGNTLTLDFRYIAGVDTTYPGAVTFKVAQDLGNNTYRMMTTITIPGSSISDSSVFYTTESEWGEVNKKSVKVP